MVDCMSSGDQVTVGWDIFCVQVIFVIVKIATPCFNRPSLLSRSLVKHVLNGLSSMILLCCYVRPHFSMLPLTPCHKCNSPSNRFHPLLCGCRLGTYISHNPTETYRNDSYNIWFALPMHSCHYRPGHSMMPNSKYWQLLTIFFAGTNDAQIRLL